MLLYKGSVVHILVHQGWWHTHFVALSFWTNALVYKPFNICPSLCSPFWPSPISQWLLFVCSWPMHKVRKGCNSCKGTLMAMCKCYRNTTSDRQNKQHCWESLIWWWFCCWIYHRKTQGVVGYFWKRSVLHMVISKSFKTHIIKKYSSTFSQVGMGQVQ